MSVKFIITVKNPSIIKTLLNVDASLYRDNKNAIRIWDGMSRYRGGCLG
jgi:hypothetical protein